MWHQGPFSEEQQRMSVATSAIESLQDVAVQAGAITTADERATAADLKIPIAAVHGARNVLRRSRGRGGGAGTSASARAPHALQPTAANTAVMSSGYSASPAAPAARLGSRARICLACIPVLQRRWPRRTR